MTDLLAGIAPHEATVVADQLRLGAPTLGWRGDMRLFLRIGYYISPKDHWTEHNKFFRKGDIVGHFFEVWRWNEDGTIERVSTWPLDKVHEIIPDLIRMDPRTPGHEQIMDRVERNNDLADRAAERRLEDAHGEMLEHMYSIAQEMLVGRPTTRFARGAKEATKTDAVG